MKILLLGTGPSKRYRRPGKSHRTRSSALVYQDKFKLLLDCSSDFYEQAQREGLDCIDAIIISHAHSDAISGLKQLKKWKQKHKIDSKIPVYAELQTFRKIKSKLGKKVFDEIAVKVIHADKSYHMGPFHITPFRVKHSIQKGFPTTGSYIEYNNERLTYVEDVDSWDKDKQKYFENQDVLIIDGAFWDRVMIPGHRAILKDLPDSIKWDNKLLVWTQCDVQIPLYEVANKIVKENVKKLKGNPDKFEISYDGMTIDVKNQKILKQGEGLTSEDVGDIESEEYAPDNMICYCPVCGESIVVRDEGVCPNCPKCGAKMIPLKTINDINLLKPKLEEINPQKLSELSNQELLITHLRLHQWFSNARQQGSAIENIVNAHAWVNKEMKKRGTKGCEAGDELQRLSEALERAKYLKAIKENWDNMKDIVIVPNYVSICGSTVEQSKIPNDVDVLYKKNRRDKELEVIINNQLPKTIDKIHTIYGQIKSHGKNVPLYDLVLRKRKDFSIVDSKPLIDLSKPIVAKKLVLRYKLDEFLKKLDDRFDKTYVLEPFIDGDRVLVSRLDGKIKLYRSNGKEFFDEELKKQFESVKHPKDFIIDGIKMKCGRYIAFDMILKNTGHLILDPLISRKVFLSKLELSSDSNIKKLKWERCFNKKDIKRFSNLYKKLGFEFVVLKSSRSKYKDNAKDWIKLDLNSKSIAPFAKIKPLKPGREYHELEFSGAEEMWRFWASGFIQKGIAVEEKFDGLRIILQKKGDEVKIYFEGGESDRSKIMPSISFYFKNQIVGDIILDGELLEFKDGKQVPRRDMVRWVQSTKPLDDSGLKIYLFDVLYYKNKDLTNLPWKERQKYLKTAMRNQEHFVKVKPIIVRNKSEFVRAVDIVSKRQNSEGSVCKVLDSVYELDGSTNYWAKQKNFKEVRVKIMTVNKKKVGYNYDCGFINKDGDLERIGTTYNTKLKAKVSDILSVAVAEILRKEVDGKIKYSWDNPIVRNIELEDTKIETWRTLDRLAGYGRGAIKMKNFDLPRDESESELKEKLISSILGIEPIKHLKIEKAIAPYKIALYSKALRELLKNRNKKIVNIKYGTKYSAPTFELLETSRDKKERLLTNGFILVKDDFPMVIYYTPGVHCQYLSIYHREENLKDVERFFGEIDKYVNENNYWKKEKITPFGKFLPLTNISKNDVILDNNIFNRIDKTIFNFFNNREKYEKAEIPFKRGVIFAGLPGTGKTLTGRIIMNNINDVTFIWVTAKDFKNLRTSYLFEMARELQPAILFIEDVDRCLTGSTLDTIKTQMDGLESNNGILTVLSTNFPKNLPKTLIDRPGRFDDVIEFELPDEELRYRILSHYSRNITISRRDETLRSISKITSGLTPAHLKEILISAYINVEHREITIGDLKDSLNNIKLIHDKFKNFYLAEKYLLSGRKQRGQGLGNNGPRQGDGGVDFCVCEICGYKIAHRRGVQCNRIICPNCNIPLVGESKEKSKSNSDNYQYYIVPGDKRKRRFVYHHHYRGIESTDEDRIRDKIKRGDSIHGDLRIDTGRGFLIGWTTFTPGSSTGSINGDIAKSKFTNHKTGQKLQVTTKLTQPVAWLDVQGAAAPGTVGATRKTWAWFEIASRGKALFGSQRAPKPSEDIAELHEYFLYPTKDPLGKVEGRWIVVGVEMKQKQKVNRKGFVVIKNDVEDIWLTKDEYTRLYLLSNQKKQKISGIKFELNEINSLFRLHTNGSIELGFDTVKKLIARSKELGEILECMKQEGKEPKSPREARVIFLMWKPKEQNKSYAELHEDWSSENPDKYQI